MKIENSEVVVYSDNDLKDYIKSEVQNDWNERDFVAQVRTYCAGESRRVLLISGLRSTGKTVGILQGIPKDNTIFICPVSKNSVSEKAIKQIISECECKNIVIDEYTWIKWEDDGNELTNYLAGQAKIGKKIILTGTESVLINKLRNTELVHRDSTIFTTYFSYQEYCRLYNLKQNDSTMKKYLTRGGIFENHAADSFGSMKDYVQRAIVSNLASYYKDFDEVLLKAAIYTIFYECVCNCYSRSGIKEIPGYDFEVDPGAISIEEYLENFGIDPATIVPTSVLDQVSDKLSEIGVVVKLQDLRIPHNRRAYITNPTISAWLTKCIFEVNDLDERYLGYLFEAAVVCYEYMRVVANNERYEMSYLHGRKSYQEYEIDFVIHDSCSAYIFECKLNDNSNALISDKASLVKDVIEDILGSKDIEIEARYVIYQGKEKCCKANGKNVIFTNNWDVNFLSFQKQLNLLGMGGDDGD